MGKDKLRRFRENETFACLVQPQFDEIFRKDHPLKGNWKNGFFKNDNPVCLELGCGRGEYTVALARMFPEINFIGVDIKGARLWRGAKTATESGMANVGFLRTRIEFIGSFFGTDEVDRIWITFPDPQVKKGRAKKRLTSSVFLTMYAGFLQPEGMIHLKTDSMKMHAYTRAVVGANLLPVMEVCEDIYGTGRADEILSVRTAYETQFLKEGYPITYLRFGLGGGKEFVEPDFEEDKYIR